MPPLQMQCMVKNLQRSNSKDTTMPQIIDHIDAIARKKQRDVLCLTFHTLPKTAENEDDRGISWVHDDEVELKIDYYDNPIRKQVLDWLDFMNIPYTKCAEVASENGWCSYRGQIYLDFPYDEDNEHFKWFGQFIQEDDQGWSKPFLGVRCWCLPLDVAMKNAHHDESGFWENWAENF